MKAILINAQERTVDYVNNTGDLSAMYDAIGCEMVEIGDYNPKTGDTLWVDEEGLLKNPSYGFVYNGKKFVGNGILYGSNIGGDNVSVKCTLEDVIPELLFFRLEPETI
jgi:hypothetical protein